MYSPTHHLSPLRTAIPRHLYEYIVTEARGICAWCRDLTLDELHHIRPVAAGGRNVYSNLIPLCASCHAKVHRYRISPGRLRSAKAHWTEHNLRILRRVFSSDTTRAEQRRRLLAAFDAVSRVEDLRRFRAVLDAQARSGNVFNNLIRVQRHDICHEVDASRNVVVTEYQAFVPQQAYPGRILQIVGPCNRTHGEVAFCARGWVGKCEVDVTCRPRIDEPRLKTYEVTFPRTLSPGTKAAIAFRYQWRGGWRLTDDAYTYDVLAWAEEVNFRLVFPRHIRVDAVETSYVDVSGRQWPNIGRSVLRGSSYTWKGERLPLFSRVIIRHKLLDVHPTAREEIRSRLRTRTRPNLPPGLAPAARPGDSP